MVNVGRAGPTETEAARERPPPVGAAPYLNKSQRQCFTTSHRERTEATTGGGVVRVDSSGLDCFKGLGAGFEEATDRDRDLDCGSG